MISVHLKPEAAPRLLAVFSYRYDAHLVPALLANIEPYVDGWISYDDRGADDLFSHEVHRRMSLLAAAREVGAQWALAVDPDERFERAIASRLPTLLDHPSATAHTFVLREMYGPLHYRIDGVWGAKRQARLLSLREGVVAPEGNLHLSWAAFLPEARINDTDINLYHLKMIAPARRRARAALYKHLDPGAVSQPFGYDYLAEDQGAQLQAIEPGRDYHPPHLEDGGLWMPSVPTP